MKRVLFSILFSLCVVFTATAQSTPGTIRTENLKVYESDGEVHVAFMAYLDYQSVPRNHTLVFAPVLTDGEFSVSLPPVVVEGKGARVAEARREWASGTIARYDRAVYAESGSAVNYTASVPTQHWMNGATLKLERTLSGCAGYSRLTDDPLVRELALWQTAEPESEIVPVPEAVWMPVTVADSLSLAFSFIQPETVVRRKRSV